MSRITWGTTRRPIEARAIVGLVAIGTPEAKAVLRNVAEPGQDRRAALPCGRGRGAGSGRTVVEVHHRRRPAQLRAHDRRQGVLLGSQRSGPAGRQLDPATPDAEPRRRQPEVLDGHDGQLGGFHTCGISQNRAYCWGSNVPRRARRWLDHEPRRADSRRRRTSVRRYRRGWEPHLCLDRHERGLLLGRQQCGAAGRRHGHGQETAGPGDHHLAACDPWTQEPFTPARIRWVASCIAGDRTSMVSSEMERSPIGGSPIQVDGTTKFSPAVAGSSISLGAFHGCGLEAAGTSGRRQSLVRRA